MLGLFIALLLLISNVCSRQGRAHPMPKAVTTLTPAALLASPPLCSLTLPQGHGTMTILESQNHRIMQ